MLPRERQRIASAGALQPQQYESKISVGRVDTNVSDPLVHGQQDAALELGAHQDNPVRLPGQSLLNDRIAFVSGMTKIHAELSGEGFVELDLHRAVTGRRRSSCASSAAYAMAASMCAAFRVG